MALGIKLTLGLVWGEVKVKGVGYRGMVQGRARVRGVGSIVLGLKISLKAEM